MADEFDAGAPTPPPDPAFERDKCLAAFTDPGAPPASGCVPYINATQAGDRVRVTVRQPDWTQAQIWLSKADWDAFLAEAQRRAT